MRRSSHLLLIVSAANAVMACGGETGVPRPEVGICRPVPDFTADYGPDEGGKAADCHALDGYEIFRLNDFEGVHDADFYFNNDRTALQTPPPDSQGVPTTPIPGGRCVGAALAANAPTVCSSPETPPGGCTGAYVPDSWYALEVRTGYLTNDGGVCGIIEPKVGCLLPDPSDASTLCPFQGGPPEVGPCSIGDGPSPPLLGCRARDDYSQWEGVVFWGRVGPGSESSLRLRASDGFTDDKGCNCNPYASQNDASDGCDKFGEFVALDANFRAFFVRFDEMQQGGWGLPRPSVDTSDIFELAFEYGAGTWDFWLDDMALFRRRP